MRGPPSARAERSAPPHVHRAGVAGRPAGRACRGGGGYLRFSGGWQRALSGALPLLRGTIPRMQPRCAAEPKSGRQPSSGHSRNGSSAVLVAPLYRPDLLRALGLA